MLGFSFRGYHCSQYGICMKSKNRMMLPEPKLFYEESLDMDGNYDFSAINSDSRIHYGNRQISVDCYIAGNSFPDLRSAARAAASWLGFIEGNIVFDDEPDVHYKGRVANKIDFNQAFRRGSFTIVFECRPFAYSNTGFSQMYQDITDARNIRFSNSGLDVRPELIVEGTFENLKLSLNGSELRYNGSGEGTLVLNGKTMSASLGSSNALPRITGEFLTVRHGVNTLNVRADSMVVNITVNFDLLYL